MMHPFLKTRVFPAAGTVLLEPVVRGLAGFLAIYVVLALGIRAVTGFDANLWWVDLRWLPSGVATGLEILAAGTLGLAALGGRRTGRMRSFARGVAVGFTTLTALDAVRAVGLMAEGTVSPGMPVPASAGFCLLWVGVVRVFRMRDPEPGSGGARDILVRMAACAAGFAVFPLVQVYCFGWTDYSRPAEVVVVPGARVYANGRLSPALAIRVREAARLYREGRVRWVVVSGGPGDGPVHETEAMEREAVRLGIPPGRIHRDPAGLSTADTVRNSLAWASEQFPGQSLPRVLVVSEFYHLPRLKLAYQHAGAEVWTVPADPRGTGRRWAFRSVARETAAFWAYWLRPLLTDDLG